MLAKFLCQCKSPFKLQRSMKLKWDGETIWKAKVIKLDSNRLTSLNFQSLYILLLRVRKRESVNRALASLNSKKNISQLSSIEHNYIFLPPFNISFYSFIFMKRSRRMHALRTVSVPLVWWV